jgi:hypothetical protein
MRRCKAFTEKDAPRLAEASDLDSNEMCPNA